MFPSRLLRFFHNKRSLNMLPLTTIPLQSRLTMMRSPSSSAHNPKSQNANVLSQLRANPEMHHQADEESQIHIEKRIGEELQHQYFSGPEFRVIVEDNQPKISHHTPNGTEHVIPASHIVLYRVEKTFPSPSSPSGGKRKGKIHTLWLYVHSEQADIVDTLTRRLSDILKEKAGTGELDDPGAAFAILQLGVKISFFRCDGNSVTSLGA